MNIDVELARKVLAVVDAGLVKGMGTPEPGKMCVEAAVNYAMGALHGDAPACVSHSLRRLKIKLNDSAWSSDQARAAGLRRLAIAQLGSAGALDEKDFAKRVSRLAIQSCVPQALRAAARLFKGDKKDAMLNAADLCEREPTIENARAARTAAADASSAAAYAAYAAASAADADAYAADAAYARDTSLAAFAEGVVQILIEMKAPGCEWLYLTEEPITPFFQR